MAYMSQEKKAKIAAALKAVMPKDWKYSLAVRHHSTLVLTIRSAPLDLLDLVGAKGATYTSVNPYHWQDHIDLSLHEQFAAIFNAMNDGNFDKSDIMTDYFHVGWYVDLNIGQYGKPFVNTTPVNPELVALLPTFTPPPPPKGEPVVNLEALRGYLAMMNHWSGENYRKFTVEGLTRDDLSAVRNRLEYDLSPENLTCDGELSEGQVAVKRNELKAVQEDIKKIEYLLGW